MDSNKGWRAGSVVKTTHCSCGGVGEDPTPKRCLKTVCNSGSRESEAPFWSLLGMRVGHIHTCEQNTSMYEIKGPSLEKETATMKYITLHAK